MSAPDAGGDHPVAFLEIGDAVGEGRERERVRAEIGLALAVADRERRALPRPDQEIVLALEQVDEGEGAAHALERRMNGLGRRLAARELVLDHEGGDLGIRLGLERVALGGEFLAQRLEILDDAVVDDGEPGRGVRMGVGLRSACRASPSAYGRCRSSPMSGAAASFASRFFSLPSARRRASLPSSSVATPAEL